MTGTRDPFQRSKFAEREKRAWPRFPSHVKTYCRSIMGEDELFWSVQVAELSRQGAKVITHRRFEPGTVLRIGVIREKAGVLIARDSHLSRPRGRLGYRLRLSEEAGRRRAAIMDPLECEVI